MTDLFHYTDAAGYEGIRTNRFIRASAGNSAKFGNGVYLTSSQPDQNRSDTAVDIFGKGGGAKYNQGKLDHYIRVKMPLSDKRLKEVRSGIFRFDDTSSVLRLDEFDWDCGENSNWSTWAKFSLATAVVAGIAALALNQWQQPPGEEETVEKKLEGVLGDFRSTQHSRQRADALSVFNPDCNSKVSIWCKLCFRQVCPGFDPISPAVVVDTAMILTCLQEHIDKFRHQINIPKTAQQAQYIQNIAKEFGEENVQMCLKLESIVNTYQNNNRQKKWIHRLEVIKDVGDSDGMVVICTRCDLSASSSFPVKDGEDGINEEEVHREIEEHFYKDILGMHSVGII